MTAPFDSEGELGIPEREVGRRLTAERPVPGAEFRGALGRWLRDHDPGYSPRPARFRAVVGLYLGSGGLLIAIGALEALGIL